MLTFFTYFLITVEVICSVLLLMIILVQRTKNQGLGLAIGGGVGESMFGAQMGNVLTKTTVVLAITFLVTTTLLAMVGARSPAADDGSVVNDAPAPVVTEAPLQMPMDTGGGMTSEMEIPSVEDAGGVIEMIPDAAIAPVPVSVEAVPATAEEGEKTSAE